MARDSYREATTVSTRTFQTSPSKSAKNSDKKEPKAKRSLLKPPHINLSAQRLPWTIIAILIIVSLFLFSQYHDAKNKLAASQGSAANQQASAIIKKVDKLVVLPNHGTPTVETVSNVSKLKSQRFFANAVKGDVLIDYQKAEVAVLYRPSTNQIVNMISYSASNAVQ